MAIDNWIVAPANRPIYSFVCSVVSSFQFAHSADSEKNIRLRLLGCRESIQTKSDCILTRNVILFVLFFSSRSLQNSFCSVHPFWKGTKAERTNKREKRSILSSITFIYFSCEKERNNCFSLGRFVYIASFNPIHSSLRVTLSRSLGRPSDFLLVQNAISIFV